MHLGRLVPALVQVIAQRIPVSATDASPEWQRSVHGCILIT